MLRFGILQLGAVDELTMHGLLCHSPEGNISRSLRSVAVHRGYRPRSTDKNFPSEINNSVTEKHETRSIFVSILHCHTSIMNAYLTRMIRINVSNKLVTGLNANINVKMWTEVACVFQTYYLTFQDYSPRLSNAG